MCPVRKGDLLVTEYVTRVKRMYDVLEASGHGITERKQIHVLLASLPVEFESVVTMTTMSSVLLNLEQVEEALIECEVRQRRLVAEPLMHANMVQKQTTVLEIGDPRPTLSGKAVRRGRGWSQRGRVQCQIYSCVGHLAQRCFYCYARPIEASPTSVVNRLYGGSTVSALPDAPRLNEHDRYNNNNNLHLGWPHNFGMSDRWV